MRAIEFITEAEVDNSRRGFLKTLGKGALAAGAIAAMPSLAKAGTSSDVASVASAATWVKLMLSKNPAVAKSAGRCLATFMAQAISYDEGFKILYSIDPLVAETVKFAAPMASNPDVRAGINLGQSELSRTKPEKILYDAGTNISVYVNSRMFAQQQTQPQTQSEPSASNNKSIVKDSNGNPIDPNANYKLYLFTEVTQYFATNNTSLPELLSKYGLKPTFTPKKKVNVNGDMLVFGTIDVGLIKGSKIGQLTASIAKNPTFIAMTSDEGEPQPPKWMAVKQ